MIYNWFGKTDGDAIEISMERCQKSCAVWCAPAI